MICKNCGRQNDENARFCVSCGNELIRTTTFRENSNSDQILSKLKKTRLKNNIKLAMKDVKPVLKKRPQASTDTVYQDSFVDNAKTDSIINKPVESVEPVEPIKNFNMETQTNNFQNMEFNDDKANSEIDEFINFEKDDTNLDHNKNFESSEQQPEIIQGFDFGNKTFDNSLDEFDLSQPQSHSDFNVNFDINNEIYTDVEIVKDDKHNETTDSYADEFDISIDKDSTIQVGDLIDVKDIVRDEEVEKTEEVKDDYFDYGISQEVVEKRSKKNKKAKKSRNLDSDEIELSEEINQNLKDSKESNSENLKNNSNAHILSQRMNEDKEQNKQHKEKPKKRVGGFYGTLAIMSSIILLVFTLLNLAAIKFKETFDPAETIYKILNNVLDFSINNKISMIVVVVTMLISLFSGVIFALKRKKTAGYIVFLFVLIVIIFSIIHLIQSNILNAHLSNFY